MAASAPAPAEAIYISIYMPRAADGVDAAGAAPPIPPSSDEPPPRRLRILLVAADPDVRSIATAMQIDAGYEVADTASGAAALLLAAADQLPDRPSAGRHRNATR